METGFWRPQRDGTIEVVLAHPGGYAEVWYGKITGAKVELATDAIVRTATAEEYNARGVACTDTSRVTCSGPLTRPRLGSAAAEPPLDNLRSVASAP